MVKQVIESWALLELINAGELPSLTEKLNSNKLKNSRKYNSVVPLSQSKCYEELQLKNPEKNNVQYRYYMNNYTNTELVILLRNFFKNNEEIINKNNQLCYSFSFDTNDKGEYIEDSLKIPHVQLIVDDIKRLNKISYHDFIDRYDEKKQRFGEEVRVIFQNGVNNETLEKVEKLFMNYFYLVTNEKRSYVQCFILKKSSTVQPSQFNSFYIEDLQSILKKGANNTLTRFIQGTDMRVNVDENREAIESILSLKNLPLGRWPSPVNHRLSLMQQVAVNHILQTDEPISSVNGPPGTGKTTLLKDIFAQLIVKRAKEMVTLSDPSKAFQKVGKQEIEMNGKTYGYNMYELDKDIAKYSMVVASSNNGAVENISKELPLLDEISRNNKPTEEEREKQRSESGIDPYVFYEYDCTYAKEIDQLDLFPTYAEKLLDDEKAWGMFSAALGKSKNIQEVSDSLQSNAEEELSYLEYLQQPLESDAWENAVKEFNDLREEIERDMQELQEYINEMTERERLEQKLKYIPSEIMKEREQQQELTQYIDRLEKENNYLKERLENFPKPGNFTKLIRSITGKKDEEEISIRNNRDDILQKIIVKTKENARCTERIKQLKEIETDIRGRLNTVKIKQNKYEKEQVTLSTNNFWDQSSYSERQVSILWQTHELNFKRGMLFLKALKVHKVFLHKNHNHLKVAITMLKNLRSINVNIEENKANLSRMWKTLHLIFPVMSTTFASFSSMYRGTDADFIDYLFIDEAGQASPQQAVGALWRSKRAIVVGDPIQIEPVVTLDETILSDVRKKFNVSEHFIGPTASVQAMADHANPIGTYKGDGDNKERIGIPLWVHRRCIEPMFSISNEIAYENKMVLAKKDVGVGDWYNIIGPAKQAQYVSEQGEFIVGKIEEYFEKVENDETPSVFVITPFTAVRKELISLVNSRLGKKIPHIKKWSQTSIGTVHTFQGKEANVVYFVTGTDKSTDGAANWSCMKPNLINVAVTRAKKEFYVVGDLKRFKSKRNYETIVNKFQYYSHNKTSHPQ